MVSILLNSLKFNQYKKLLINLSFFPQVLCLGAIIIYIYLQDFILINQSFENSYKTINLLRIHKYLVLRTADEAKHY